LAQAARKRRAELDETNRAGFQDRHMVKLVINNGVQQGRAFQLKSGVNRLGRNVENHFQIPDPSVSGTHCELILSSDGILVHDLGSTNGTCIDGEPVATGSLGIGQTLQLGAVGLLVAEAAAVSAGPEVVVPELSIPRPPASIVLPDGSLACANHSELRGSFRCTQCHQVLCETCVRMVRRVSGDSLVFCSLCAGPCEVLLPPAAPPPAKKSLFGRLTQTLRLRPKHKPLQAPKA
jgi:hypothetical protein